MRKDKYIVMILRCRLLGIVFWINGIVSLLPAKWAIGYGRAIGEDISGRGASLIAKGTNLEIVSYLLILYGFVWMFVWSFKAPKLRKTATFVGIVFLLINLFFILGLDHSDLIY